MPRLMEISPADAFVDVNVGELFTVQVEGKDRHYHLHSRDPWKIYAVRYTRLDSIVYHIGQAIKALFSK